MRSGRHSAVVLEQNMIAKDIFSLRIKTPVAAEALPGQFINLYSADPGKMLPRPISICDADPGEGTLRMVYRIAGAGTMEFSRLEAGDEIDILGPLGNGFPDMSGRRVMLIGGGIGIPPMLYLAKKYGTDSVAVLGYRDEAFLLSDFGQTGCSILTATEDGSMGTKGTVIDAIKASDEKADVIFACGPLPMLRAVAAYAEANDIRCFVSMEERMACGVGACLGCITKTKDVDDHSQVKNARICKDGPVFDSGEVAL